MSNLKALEIAWVLNKLDIREKTSNFANSN